MRTIILGTAIFGGIAAALTGLGLGGVLLLIAAFGGGAFGGTLMIGALAFGVVASSLALGLALAWSGWRGLSGAASGPLRLPGWGWWLLAFGLAVAIGYGAFELGATAPVAVLHVGASAAAVLWALALALGSARNRITTRSGIEALAGISGSFTQPAKASIPDDPPSALTARPAIGSLAWGGLGGVGLALVVEGLVGVVIVLFVSIWLTSARPDLLAQLQAWAEGMQRGRPADLSDLAPLLDSPLLVLGVLALASIFVPVVEEIAKALAVPLVALTGRRMRRVDGFLLGAAAGAGFALVEGVLNGALGLTAPAAWAGAMLSRGAATTMHCAASGVAGLGWALILERRWLPGLTLGLVAVALHGAWNAAAIGLAARAVFGGENILAALIVMCLVGLWLFAALLLALLPGWLARRDAVTLTRK